MSGLHYKQDGSLDMRYSSSKAAVASSSYSSGGNSRSGGYSSGLGEYTFDLGSFGAYSSYSSGGGDLQYKKDGSLDMRYASSKQAVSSATQSSGRDDLHYKTDGSLDMRYASSKQAVSSATQPSVRDDLNYKKDGTLDMRYASSKQAAAQTGYTGSSRVDRLADATSRLSIKQSPRRPNYNIPSAIPTKADGTPDMRNRAAKEWVKSQAEHCRNRVPDWVPKKKDGTIDMCTAVGRAFACAMPRTPETERAERQCNAARDDYWRQRMADDDFYSTVMSERQQSVCLPQRTPLITDSLVLYNKPPTQSQIVPSPPPSYYEPPSRSQSVQSPTYSENAHSESEFADWAESVPDRVPQIAYKDLLFPTGTTDENALGRGSFGVVLKAQWKGLDVAVKKLHLDKLTRKEKDSFCKELQILAHLGSHANLVKLHGYCLDPPCIVMELVSLGSLSYLLHYCEDQVIEAKMTDGRIKKNLLFGTANGMLQLHRTNIVHGDLKPQNILVTDQFVAKVTDFGLSTLRVKSQTSVASKQFDDHDGEATMAGGTAGYMAPELLDQRGPPELSSDVYSFGIVFNEVIIEEEPYSDQYHIFHGRGPFAAALYAKQGNRPTIKPETPAGVQELINRCWSAASANRPTFDEIIRILENPSFVIPNSC